MSATPPPGPPAPRAGRVTRPADTRRARLAGRLLVTALVGIFLLSVAGFVSSVMEAGPAADGSPSPSVPPGTTASGPDAPPPRIRLAAAGAEATPDRPSARPTAAAATGSDPSSAPAALSAGLTTAEVPIVPVAGFWSKRASISLAAAERALMSGTLRGFRRVVVDERVAAALAERLGTGLHASVGIRPRERVEAAVAKGALGFLAVTDVTPRVRALDLGDASLFGNARLGRAQRWPLLGRIVIDTADREPDPSTDPTERIDGEAAPLAAAADADKPTIDGSSTGGAPWSMDRTWVLVAGGDSFTDRGVYDNVVRKGKGVDFPFDGGTAQVTGHGCCDPVFRDNVVPRYRLTGNKGIVRRLFRDADLAITNHEAPVTDGWAFHPRGTRFSGKPELTRIFTRAGIDWVSLANNHIKDYGSEGIADTRRILRKHGIAFGGAGRDLAQARKVRPLEVNGTSVAIIPCVGVARSSWAGPRTSGGTPCLDRYLVPDIKKAARRADLVIVFPHWGVEYTRQPLPSMRKHAARWAKAGADLILGAHSHVAGAIEDIDGTPVLYSMGNLIFDQHWSTNTMESFLVEATFHGPRLVQVRLHPYIVHSQSQPNLLDPAKGEGRRLLRQVKAASSDWLDW